MTSPQTSSHNIPMLSLPEPEKYHRVYIVNARIRQVNSAKKHEVSNRKDCVQLVKVLEYTMQFTEPPYTHCVLNSAVRLSNQKNSKYGKLLQAAGINLKCAPVELTHRLTGSTFLVRLRHIKHSVAGVALKVIETQPDYAS